MVDALMTRALRALSRPDPPAFRACVAEPAGRRARPVDRLLPARLQEAVAAAWHRGRQPADVARYTGRTFGDRHRRLVVDVIAAESRAHPAAATDPQWLAQLAALDARVWWTHDHDLPRGWCRREGVDRAEVLACALEVLHLLGTLPRLPKIAPLPGEPAAAAAGPVDERMSAKVRALPAKAESTEFSEEAEALSARAQELMARHSIDRALLGARAGGAAAAAGPAGRRLAVDAPYESPKTALLTVVAEANGCRAVWHRELGFSTVLGFPADLAAVEMMFTSLLVQATAAMVRAGARRDAGGRSRTRSFRHAFLNAYAARIGERLRDAADRAARDANRAAAGRDAAGGGTASADAPLPVLAARDRAVDRAVDGLFPDLIRSRARAVSNYEGWVAGRAAADLAGLASHREIADRR
ncbi:hypothetical protein Acsp04_47740 [Actinomadura sp. NBRC 104425]|uniref:DUF2786 domain-containing protein n=1 Tax=Actinomadura sp. NBRC 104425 TaxID=3032204 RepID=UPI0024A16FB1|nr:DUF2786 domain-containing protein [Actinomadura sp. NBRC 104425]GLZ14539.1 hypothetical protein Acsp04_47740 [Actinomadura sp. NBRC 104425]